MTGGPTRPVAPQSRGACLVAAGDLGTNNCRLLIGTSGRAGVRVVGRLNRIVRLGEGLEATGRLGEPAMQRAIVETDQRLAAVPA